MTNNEIKEFYQKQVKWYNDQVNFCSDQIAWINKQMHYEIDNYGFETLDFRRLEKQRSKLYKERIENRKKVAKYTKLFNEF